ncbi:ATP-binding cassette domain-containing protein, partial [Acinetobacter baumannii]
QDDRIALIGANGNGKTTFAKFLCDRLEAQSGEKRQSAKMRVGYFAQHQVDELTLNQNAVWHLRQLLPEMPEDKLRARLASFGF